NVSSERSEARRKLRECSGLVDSLMYIVQSQINCKDVDNKLIENSVCLLRNLSYQYGRYIRAMLRQEHGLPMMTELLSHGNDRVVRAMSGALRNLAIDARNRELLGKHAVPNLVANLPGGGQSQPVRALSEETVVSVLSTMVEVVGSSVDAAKSLRSSQGIERLVLINKDSNRSDREVRGAGLVLQIVWGFKELRRTLEKDGWKKTDFMVNLNPPNNTRSNGGYEDSTLPLIDRGGKQDRDRDMIPLNDMGPDAYSTLDQRGRRNTLDDTLDRSDREAPQGGMYGERRGSLPLLDSYDG
ncbi:hypothetical protein cypCar_00006457, partial [Cyprinus carpio]